MKTIEVTFYKLDELSDKAKDFAIQDNIDILTDFGSYWYDLPMDDFKYAGIDVQSFDLQKREVEIDFYDDLNSVCNKIIKTLGCDIGEMCGNYLRSIDAQLALDETDDEMLEDMEMVFIYDLKCEILSWFQKEYDYLTDPNVISDYLSINEYDFDANGKIQW